VGPSSSAKVSQAAPFVAQAGVSVRLPHFARSGRPAEESSRTRNFVRPTDHVLRSPPRTGQPKHLTTRDIARIVARNAHAAELLKIAARRVSCATPSAVTLPISGPMSPRSENSPATPTSAPSRSPPPSGRHAWSTPSPVAPNSSTALAGRRSELINRLFAPRPLPTDRRKVLPLRMRPTPRAQPSPDRPLFFRFGWLSSTSGRLGVVTLHRVTERRRAAQLARDYRDQEGLAIAEIARRLGRAEATIKSYDPTGDKARAVKARYRGVCRGCGAPTAPRNDKGDAYAYCTLPSRRDRAGMDTGTGSRSDARPASALRRCALLVRLVAHARTPTRRRSAHTTTSRRMARAVHCHRSVRGLGEGPRRRLQRRLSVRASMPLTYERTLAVGHL